MYRSESETGHRNRAIGHMLRNFDILTEPPEPVVDLYFKQCSVSVTCRDLGVMAATLANRGVNPLTRKQAIRGEYVESVISVMASCGMYDYAGEWLYRIGMPAKSGVAGGVIAVLPGQLGIGVFSPCLDARGNSVRGIQVCDALSRALDLHLFNLSSSTRSVIRLRFTGAEVNSSRLRHAGGSEAAARIRQAHPTVPAPGQPRLLHLRSARPERVGFPRTTSSTSSSISNTFWPSTKAPAACCTNCEPSWPRRTGPWSSRGPGICRRSGAT